jgi:hypothetical protein
MFHQQIHCTNSYKNMAPPVEEVQTSHIYIELSRSRSTFPCNGETELGIHAVARTSTANCTLTGWRRCWRREPCCSSDRFSGPMGYNGGITSCRQPLKTAPHHQEPKHPDRRHCCRSTTSLNVSSRLLCAQKCSSPASPVCSPEALSNWLRTRHPGPFLPVSFGGRRWESGTCRVT